jgi:hypothetical protein
MNFCPVQADTNRHYSSLDRGESKRARLKTWLKDSGRVEDAIRESMRDEGDYHEFVKQHIDGFAVTQLGYLATNPDKNFDADYLKQLARGIEQEFIADQYDAFEDVLIEREWNYFE